MRLAFCLALALATGVAAPVAQATDFTEVLALLRVHVVEPRDPEFCNNDVCVRHDADSGNDIKVSPGRGTRDSDSEVEFVSRARGAVTGLDSGDTVRLSSNTRASITGMGGTIELGGTDIRGTVTNNARDGGPSIRVNFPGGGYVDVPPGTTNLAFGT
jgi:hypothetical protein